MASISTKSLFDKDIKKIWNDNSNHNELTKLVIDRNYWLQDEIRKNAILFIGINPSFAGGKILKENYYNLELENNFYQKYHKKFEDIHRKTGLDWTHFDLLFFRETSQKFCDKIEKTLQGKKFIKSQLNIAEQVIKLAEPKMIIVSNTLARRFFGKYKTKKDELPMNFKFEFNEDYGTDVLVSNDDKLNGTPVFFTSMLTGQRAIDKGSYERLVWQINFIKNKMK